MAFPADPPTVAVIGGGFSGLLTAIHLLRQDPEVVVRLVERAPRFGRGRAYQTSHPDHLLNVRASNMSAFPDQPGHFRAWLEREGEGGADGFVSRGRYGDYLQSLLREEVSDPSRAGRFLLEADEAVALEPAGGRIRVALAVGRSFDADAAVLALGLLPPAPPPGATPEVLAHPAYVADPWRLDPAAAPDGDILLIGSGLTMVDVALSLAGEGRRLTALSRHGLISHSHAPTTGAPAPEGALSTPRVALRTLRAQAEKVGWREAVDGIRPLTAEIWRSWPLGQRRRFLRHARPWWDVHRHRMAPVIAARLSGLVVSAELEVQAGRLDAVACEGEGFVVRYRPRGERQPVVRTFSAIVNCTGPRGDPEAATAGLLADLRRRGALRRDPLGLGLDVDERLRVIGADGRPTPGLFAVGPLTRAAVWEALAVPDLRNQTAEVARTVTEALRLRRAA
ncbi:FAD/NAD(P)-binding protein [Phenylobacterium sp.]|uniref:FAD/NAD(P)-binding protein n=1 Tax=Phenylobacterium sp. TaxID=1871053 RepID=UPI0035AED44C